MTMYKIMPTITQRNHWDPVREAHCLLVFVISIGFKGFLFFLFPFGMWRGFPEFRLGLWYLVLLVLGGGYGEWMTLRRVVRGDINSAHVESLARTCNSISEIPVR